MNYVKHTDSPSYREKKKEKEKITGHRCTKVWTSRSGKKKILLSWSVAFFFFFFWWGVCYMYSSTNGVNYAASYLSDPDLYTTSPSAPLPIAAAAIAAIAAASRSLDLALRVHRPPLPLPAHRPPTTMY